MDLNLDEGVGRPSRVKREVDEGRKETSSLLQELARQRQAKLAKAAARSSGASSQTALRGQDENSSLGSNMVASVASTPSGAQKPQVFPSSQAAGQHSSEAEELAWMDHRPTVSNKPRLQRLQKRSEPDSAAALALALASSTPLPSTADLHIPRAGVDTTAQQRSIGLRTPAAVQGSVRRQPTDTFVDVVNLCDEAKSPPGSASDLLDQMARLNIAAKPGSSTSRPCTSQPGSKHMTTSSACTSGSSAWSPDHCMHSHTHSPDQKRPDDVNSSAECGDHDDEAAGLVLGDKREFRLDSRVSKMLYAHQVEGVKWLWRLHQMQRGGCLGDDMGLGKTMQCSAFLAGMFSSKLIRRALVVAPKTLLAHWVKELTLCGLSHCVYEYFGTSQAERDNALRRVMSGRGVLLTTYGMVLHNAAALCQRPRYLIRGGRDEAEEDEGKPLWDFLFCDEGHKIKNPKMQLAQRMRELPVAVRVIISGTPIQNNLMELHTLFDFACEGLLGDARTFKSTVERRIMAGNDKHATQRERETGAAQAAELRAQIAPYFLRREKKEVFKSKDSEPASGTAEGDAGSESSASSGSSAPQPQSMGRKNDLIVWLQLQPLQQRVYEAFLQSEAVKAVFNQTGTALAALTVLKKVCDHPVLLSKRAANLVASAGERIKQRQRDRDLSDFIVDDDDGSQYETGSEGSEGSEDEADRSRASSAGPADDWTEWAAGTSVEEKLLSELTKKGADASCKTSFVMGLLAELVAGGHRTLVFSQSRVMLDILQAAVEARMWRFCRIDGSVSSATERQERVQQFQTSKSIPVFLLTSQVGGLGLTLTAADRVIIVDPSWNPSVDNQSVDRAYRIGQQRDVVVYRLITCGTVEEKIYRKQVFKGALSRSGTEDGLQFRYFSQQELRDLFTIVPEDLIRSQTQQQLHSMHAGQRRTTPELDAHLAFLQALPNYTGISDHDLMFSQKDKHEGPGIASTNSFANAVPGVRQPGSARATPAQRRSAASQGWRGSGKIADMFSALALGGGSRGAAVDLTQEPDPPADPAADRRQRLQQLRSQEQKFLGHLASAAALSLPDGGAKLQRQLAAIRQEMRHLAAAEPASATAPLSPPPPSSNSSSTSGSGTTRHGSGILNREVDEGGLGSYVPSAGGRNGLMLKPEVPAAVASAYDMERWPGGSGMGSRAAAKATGPAQHAAADVEVVDLSSPQQAAPLAQPTSGGSLLADAAGVVDLTAAAAALPRADRARTSVSTDDMTVFVAPVGTSSDGNIDAQPRHAGHGLQPRHSEGPSSLPAATAATAAETSATGPASFTAVAMSACPREVAAPDSPTAVAAKLQADIKAMKQKLIKYVNILNDTQARQRLPDNGRQIKQKAKALQAERNQAKEVLAALERSMAAA